MAAQILSKPKFMEVIRRWDWLLILIISPIMMFPDLYQGWALIVIPCVLVVQWLAWREVLPVTPLNPAILLMVVMVGISVYVTPNLTSSLGKITGVFFGVMVYFCIARHGRTQSGWRNSLVFLILISIGLAILGLIGTKWFAAKIIGMNVLTGHLTPLITGLPGAENGIHPNELAGALLWVIPVVILAALALMVDPGWFARRSHRGHRRFWQISAWALLLILAMLMTVGILVLLQSRGGYLAIALTGAVLVVLLLRGRARWGMIILLAIDAIVVLIAIRQIGWKVILSQVVEILPMDPASSLQSTMILRTEIWSRAIWAIKDVPLTGIGMNIFRSGMFLLYPTFRISAGSSIGHAHNELLQAALDLGLPGLVGFLALYAGGLGMLVPTIRSKGAWRILALGLMGGLLAHFIYGITDTVALGAKPGFIFWWMLGMAYGLYDQNRRANEKMVWKKSTSAG